jgi:hypothetical protein
VIAPFRAGRTNRTHQASAPVFRPVTTDCRGERRFISTSPAASMRLAR